MRAKQLSRIDYRISYIPLHKPRRWRRLRAWLESIGFVLAVGVLNSMIGG